MELVIYRFFSQGGLYVFTTLFFLLSAILYFVFFRNPKLRYLGTGSLAFTFLLLTYYILHVWLSTGQPPFKTLFQSLVFLTWNFSIVYLILELSEKIFFAGGFVALTNFLILFTATIFSDIVQVFMPPSLQSLWFIPHVVLYFAGYAFLFIGFLMSIFYLFFPERKYLGETHWSGQKWLDFDQYAYRAIVFGYTFLTFGLVVGAIWAKVAWGSPWSWDPKENWALITWLIYGVYLHMRYVRGWKGKKANIISIIGFLIVLITYIGVNYLPSAASALHSYQ